MAEAMKKRVPVVLILAGFLLIGFAASYAVWSATLDQPGAAPLPPELVGIPLSQSAVGKAAAIEINNLHHLEFPMTSASVGVYGPGQAILWVAGTPVNLLAERMLVEMREKIAEGNSPFSPTGARQDGKRPIYELDGLGQKHFYFRSGSLLIWVAADAEQAEQALAQTLEYYR
jgi:hypothetical protein